MLLLEIWKKFCLLFIYLFILQCNAYESVHTSRSNRLKENRAVFFEKNSYWWIIFDMLFLLNCIVLQMRFWICCPLRVCSELRQRTSWEKEIKLDQIWSYWRRLCNMNLKVSITLRPQLYSFIRTQA